MAKTGLWAEIQRERARQQRFRDQEFRALRQAEERAERERVKAQKVAARKAAVELKEAKRLYLEDRRAEAAEMAQLLENRVNELDNVLTVGVRTAPLVTFRSLKRPETYPRFGPGPLGNSLPPPQWEQFAPDPPGGFADGSARLGMPEKSRKRVQHSTAPVGATRPRRQGGGSNLPSDGRRTGPRLLKQLTRRWSTTKGSISSQGTFGQAIRSPLLSSPRLFWTLVRIPMASRAIAG